MSKRSKKKADLAVVHHDQQHVAARPVMLLVLGPHRSGTSLTARMLECLGAENSRNLLPPQPDNPTGFFEDAEIYAFNEGVLLPALQRRWFSIATTDWSVLSKAERSRLGMRGLEILRRNYTPATPLSVLKEPRLNNTLPFWVSLLEHAGFDARFVCTVRDPVSVSRSLVKRNEFTMAHGSLVYLSAWLSILPHLQDRQVAFVQFDEIFASPSKVLERLAAKLSLPIPPDFEQRVHKFSSEHLDPSLRHSELPREDILLEPELPPLVAELYRVLLDAAQSQNIRKTAKFLTHAEAQLHSMAPLLGDYDATQTKLATVHNESEAAKAECSHLRSQLGNSAQENNAALIAERETLAARVSALEEEHSELAARHSSLVADRNALAARISYLESENSSLSTRHSALTTSLDQFETKHSLLVTEREALAQERDRLAAECDSVGKDLAELRRQHAAILGERDTIRTELATVFTEKSDLRSKVNALEHSLHDRLSELAKAARMMSTMDELATECELLNQDYGRNGSLLTGIRIKNAIISPPHSHIEFTCTSATTPRFEFSDLVFRVVEHNGRFGLCLFRGNSSLPPLSMWHTHGKETGGSYMLIIPFNKSGGRLLKELDAADIAFIRLLLRAAHRRLSIAHTSEQGSALAVESLPYWIKGTEALIDALATNERRQLLKWS